MHEACLIITYLFSTEWQGFCQSFSHQYVPYMSGMCRWPFIQQHTIRTEIDYFIFISWRFFTICGRNTDLQPFSIEKFYVVFPTIRQDITAAKITDTQSTWCIKHSKSVPIRLIRLIIIIIIILIMFVTRHSPIPCCSSFQAQSIKPLL